MDSDTTELVLAVIGGGGVVKIIDVIASNRRKNNAQDIDADTAMRSELLAAWKAEQERADQAQQRAAAAEAAVAALEQRERALMAEVERLNGVVTAHETRIHELEDRLEDQAAEVQRQIRRAVEQAITDLEKTRAPEVPGGADD